MIPRHAVSWLFLLVAACASSEQKLDASRLQVARGRTIGVVASEPPSFWVTTRMGLVGVSLPLPSREIISKNHIPDPAPWIGGRLVVALAEKYALVARTPRPVSWTTREVGWDTDFVLQIATESWQIFPYTVPEAWLSSWVSYKVKVTLRDSRDHRLIASGDCATEEPEDTSGARSYNELVTGGAAILQATLREAAGFCAQKLAREVLGFRLPEDLTIEVDPKADPRVVYAPCHLEETPAWKDADAKKRQRLLQQCWDQRRAVKHPSEWTWPPATPPPPAIIRVAPR